jgi:hypothetical protein
MLNLTGKLAIGMIELAISLLSTSAFAAESPTGQDPDELLQRIRTRTIELLSQLPNYTCHEVVDRLIKRRNSGSLDRVDTVELEVAFVGNREMFARPGAARFEERSITKLVSGTIGNGAFGSHADSIFSGDAASFKYIGPQKKDGHKTFRYDFRVPQEKSRFLVKHGSAEAIVAYQGSFWVDVETLDLVRLELKADHIPSNIEVRLVEESMRYTQVRIRDSYFLLARDSELAATESLGDYSLNIIRLERCREFSGESVVTYGASPDVNSADRQKPEQ